MYSAQHTKRGREVRLGPARALLPQASAFYLGCTNTCTSGIQNSARKLLGTVKDSGDYWLNG